MTKLKAERPAELLDAAIDYVVQHGLGDVSLRPLAKSIGSSPRGLLYHFGSKAQLIAEVFAELRRRQQLALGTLPARGFTADGWAAWKQMSAPASLPYFRLLFEAFGIALRDPARHRVFLAAIVEDWVGAIAEPLRAGGIAPAAARVHATIVLAGLRGFMLDYCTTGDGKRVDRAVKAFFAAIDPTAAASASASAKVAS